MRMFSREARWLVLLAVSVTTAVVLGGQKPSQAADTDRLTGRWTALGLEGTGDVVRDGSEFAGSIQVTHRGGADLPRAKRKSLVVTGQVVDSEVSFSVYDGDLELGQYRGKAHGNQVTGTYVRPNGERGWWSGSLLDAGKGGQSR